MEKDEERGTGAFKHDGQKVGKQETLQRDKPIKSINKTDDERSHAHRGRRTDQHIDDGRGTAG